MTLLAPWFGPARLPFLVLPPVLGVSGAAIGHTSIKLWTAALGIWIG